MVPAYSGLSYESVGAEHSFCDADSTVKLENFFIPDQLPSLNGKGNDHPFFLQRGNHLYHADTITQDVAFLRNLLNEPFVEIGTEDASSLGLKNGDTVKVTGKNGGEVVLKLKINPLFSEKIAFIPDNFKESRVNKLMSGKEALQRVKISKT